MRINSILSRSVRLIFECAKSMAFTARDKVTQKPITVHITNASSVVLNCLQN